MKKPSVLPHPSFANLAGTFLAIAVWSILVLASLLTQREQLNRTAAELARIDAIANLKKDMTIRKWASNVQGVFIREEHVPPFNSLEEEERVVATNNSGNEYHLVSVTPIHLLLAIQGATNKDGGLHERLTSKQLRNIGNSPDDWEKQALEALEKGADIVTENLPRKGSHGLMRAMIPMRMEKECLDCHRDTLVPVGGLRGGASIAIDLNTYRSAQEPTWQAIRYWHGGIWLLGVATILLLHYIARRRAADLARQEEMRKENEAAFGAMAEGAVITDASGTILWVNDAFCAITGYQRHEVIGNNPRVLKSGVHDRNFYAALWQQLSHGGHWRGEIWNKRKNGEVYPEEISMQGLRGPDGQIRRYISIFSDITERKKNENELAAFRDHLQDLVRQRTEELSVALDQAEAANRSKSIFLANMNHELRTPLNAVIGFSQLMAKDSSLAPTLQHNLEIINHSGLHLLTLINDILELSKIESGKLTVAPEEVALHELLDQVVEMMRLRAEESGLSLNLDCPASLPVVTLDPGMLRQILLNLLSNAIKFTPQGEVKLVVSASQASDGKVTLTFHVRDTGIGIAAENLERIFGSFEQIGPAHRGGTGLGLTISRRYVEMMGGQLHVDSTLGKGSDFHFTIEVLASETPASTSPASRITALSVPPELDGFQQVLLVDDNAESRLLLRALLEPLGWQIQEAVSLAEAENLLSGSQPDLLFVDWYLPDGTGIELIERLRATGNPSTRIIMLTANALSEARQAALEAGANAFLGKPFDENELFELLAVASDSTPQAAEASAPVKMLPIDCRNTIAQLPEDRRARLVRAAISLNADEINDAIAGIAECSPALAEQLAQLCRHRHYEQLWQLLDILEQEE